MLPQQPAKEEDIMNLTKTWSQSSEGSTETVWTQAIHYRPLYLYDQTGKHDCLEAQLGRAGVKKVQLTCVP